MPNRVGRGNAGKRPRAAAPRRRSPATPPVAESSVQPELQQEQTRQQTGAPLNTLKSNLSGKRKAIFQILDDVKKVKPEQWKDPQEVESLAKSFADKLGLPVPEQRLKQFLHAYTDATKDGPNASVDDLVKKYGKNVDEQTLKEIKKFVPKSKN
ncbi:MAG: hypothetical protein OWQ59_01400 [Alicyclobacillaceae bacterium]|uniref:hypothetical protein n=1 Tax=Alicyclobacillus sp. SP_1 TaxID=2942475 RepID=UPI0021584445|nr:hypothetical protein [Alicyclobacillus sp. SP_1]MCY0887093.1 hypothetical protein [Alicyclobacillaceae bacterium]MCY0894896.1 hypothetical protein [Alicyclobacillaceae bacterium]